MELPQRSGQIEIVRCEPADDVEQGTAIADVVDLGVDEMVGEVDLGIGPVRAPESERSVDDPLTKARQSFDRTLHRVGELVE